MDFLPTTGDDATERPSALGTYSNPILVEGDDPSVDNNAAVDYLPGQKDIFNDNRRTAGGGLVDGIRSRIGNFSFGGNSVLSSVLLSKQNIPQMRTQADTFYFARPTDASISETINKSAFFATSTTNPAIINVRPVTASTAHHPKNVLHGNSGNNTSKIFSTTSGEQSRNVAQFPKEVTNQNIATQNSNKKSTPSGHIRLRSVSAFSPVASRIVQRTSKVPDVKARDEHIASISLNYVNQSPSLLFPSMSNTTGPPEFRRIALSRKQSNIAPKEFLISEPNEIHTDESNADTNFNSLESLVVPEPSVYSFERQDVAEPKLSFHASPNRVSIDVEHQTPVPNSIKFFLTGSTVYAIVTLQHRTLTELLEAVLNQISQSGDTRPIRSLLRRGPHNVLVYMTSLDVFYWIENFDVIEWTIVQDGDFLDIVLKKHSP